MANNLPVIKHDPVGSISGLAEIRLNPAQYGSCSEPVKKHDGSWKNRGCDAWEECQLRQRFAKKFKGEEGPRNGGVRFVKEKNGRRVVIQFKDSCFGYNAKKPQFDIRGPLDWIADEGESIKEIVTVARDENIPGQGIVRFWDSKVIDSPIPAFPKPSENQQLIGDAYANEVAEDAAAKRSAKRSDEAIGLEAQADMANKRVK